MQFRDIGDLLAPAGLMPPTLRALIPNEDNYSALLLQPQGRIEASAAGVRHRNRALAQAQFQAFLGEARRVEADLALTPEYSLPWEVLSQAIKTGCVPAEGSLWALGCESIRYAELVTLRNDLALHATVLFEELEPDGEKFLDPLAYVFIASDAVRRSLRVVVLVQFKTYPMGDDDHFEINGLQRGTVIYRFGSGLGNPHLISLICSDVFAFRDDDALAIYDRALVLHIQLNAKPRQSQYRGYRDRLFQFGGGATELVCLNWARNVYEECGATSKCWNNISGSAWYLSPDTFDDRDDTLSHNHRRGLYYTWFHSMRSHALFFNYAAGVYCVIASKIVHVGVTNSLSRRRGPQLTRLQIWDEHNSAWVDHREPCDGFAHFLSECGNAQDEIKRLADLNPFDTERILALCSGSVGANDEWYTVRNLDSCRIETSFFPRRGLDRLYSSLQPVARW